MVNPRRAFRRSLRTALLSVAFAAVAFAVSFYLTRPNYALHIRTARELIDRPTFSRISLECNQAERCKNGDAFNVYFFANHSGYMITVITIPGGAQYYKIEPFDYSRSRAIADPAVDFEERNIVWLIDRGPKTEQDIWQIRNAETHSDLRNILKDNAFNRVAPSPNK